MTLLFKLIIKNDDHVLIIIFIDYNSIEEKYIVILYTVNSLTSTVKTVSP